jgi:DNA-directed RNA polymerase subunit RPC12/RpoP
MPGNRRDAYRDAIEKVRAEHAANVKPGQMTVECPRCGTKQVLSDVPGKRVCMKCGFEFRKLF